jgi:TolB-like protein/DNA-binding winged helix-turn-helix (wHTH) protein/Flp pilus assembly protein TadD
VAGNTTSAETFTVDGWRVRPDLARIERGDQSVHVTPRSMAVLVYLAKAGGAVVSRDQILDAVWARMAVSPDALSQCLVELRKAFGDDQKNPNVIQTIPKVGVRLLAPVEVVGADAAAASSARTISPSAAELPAPREEAAPTGGDDTAAAEHPVKSAWRNYAAAAVLAVLAIGGTWVWLSDREVRPASLATDAPARDNGAARAVLPNSVAVLPLANLSPGPDQAAYADGMHAEITHQLSKLRKLNVIAREAVLQNVGNRSLAERARDLGVQSILTGTFQYLDERIRINVQLVDPVSNRNVWTEDYEERFEDVFAVQADIARRVAAALGAELTVAERQRIEMRATTSGEAYAIYLLALNHQNADRRIDALSLFQRAVEIDPEFSLAYGKLALLYALSLIDFTGGPAVSIAPTELERRVSENARAALNLDPDSGAAYAALGVMHALFWRWSEAEAAYASALALNPNDLDALNFYATFQASRGEYREAMPLAQRILELNSYAPSPESLYNVWLAHAYSGNVDAALEVLEETLAHEPAQMPARINLGYINARDGKSEDAARAFRRVEEATEGRRSPNLIAGLAYGYSRIGYATEAMRLFEEIRNVADERSVGAATWALAYLAIGAEEQALEWLDDLLEKIENNEPDAGWFNSMAIKHNVTGDPVLEETQFKERRDRIRGS